MRENKKNYLRKEFKGKIFKLKEWKPQKENPNWSHDHCEICNIEISNLKDCKNKGYTDDKNFYWICGNCFNKYKDELELKRETKPIS
jgi:hypothetical protein